MKRLVLSIFIFSFCTPILAQPAMIPQTIKQLRQFKAGVSNQLPTGVRPLLTQLKQQLLDLIRDTIQAPGNQRKTPAQLQKIVREKLARIGVNIEEASPSNDNRDNSDEYRYGDINEITVQYLSGNSELLAATTNIGVCCGEDTSLYIFQRHASRWQLVLRQEANGYKEISGAQGRFRYAISQPDRNHHFFVVTTRVNPWCTSNWQGLYYQVLRPGLRPDAPKVLFSEMKSIYLGTDPDYTFKLIGNTFTLRFETKATKREIWNGATSHSLKLMYAVTGNQVKRLRARIRK